MQEIDEFLEQHPQVLNTVKVPQEDIRAKARILVLLSIASRENELSFAAIKVRTQLYEVCRHHHPLSGVSAALCEGVTGACCAAVYGTLVRACEK